MPLRLIDLNLLVILDVLLDEAHVSRASARLGLSQPATSASLARLRDLFGDQLLERSEGSFRLTPLAESLRGRLKEILSETRLLLKREPLDISGISRTVRITTADHITADLAGRIHLALAASAPGIELVFQPYHGADATLDALVKGAVDLAISILPHANPPILREELFRERWRIIMRRGHPAAAAFDFDAWLAHPHISISGAGELRVSLDNRLDDLGRRRRIALVVPSFLAVPPILLDTDLIAMVPSRSIPDDDSFVTFDPPMALDPFPVHIAWHARHEADVAMQHLRSLIRNVATGRVHPLNG